MWNDGYNKYRSETDGKDTLRINSAIITGSNQSSFLLIFTDTNAYKIGRNKNGKFPKNLVNDKGKFSELVQIVPEINWKFFFVSGMKHVYLLNN